MTQFKLAIDYVPQKLRDHGLRDAHTFPLVSPNTGKVERSFRQPASVAWRFPRIELRAGNSFPAITVDCDGPQSLRRLGEWVRDAAMPSPNVVVQRVASGNCHCHYFLATPVHRGDDARLKPIQLLGRVSEWLTQQLEGDRGFTGVLCHNPAWDGPEFKVEWCRSVPWELRELQERIPKGWRVPAPPSTAFGRNSTLFAWAVKEAHRPRSAKIIHCGGRHCPAWEGIVHAKNEELFGWEKLPYSEVCWIAKSAARYSMRQYSGQRFREIQRVRGTRSGASRRKDGSTVSREVSQPWKADGISRATWYRRRAAATEP